MLERIFCLFQCSRNIQCKGSSVNCCEGKFTDTIWHQGHRTRMEGRIHQIDHVKLACFFVGQIWRWSYPPLPPQYREHHGRTNICTTVQGTHRRWKGSRGNVDTSNRSEYISGTTKRAQYPNIPGSQIRRTQLETEMVHPGFPKKKSGISRQQIYHKGCARVTHSGGRTQTKNI